ncbi:MAG: FAD-binding oxidoreductase [Myxococcales bacterium]|nr:FAD-binding oxidoreductase [Myxococcales bacterium]
MTDTRGDARRVSHWGWGWEDRFPAREERRRLGQLVTAALGFAPSRLDDPRALSDVDVGAARIAPPRLLAAICTADREARVRHTYGRSYRDVVRGFRGDFRGAPDLVVRPRSALDVAATLDWASGERVAVIPYGGGTSVVGGVEPVVPEGYRGTLSLDLRGLDRLLDVDRDSLSARIEAGATGPRLEAQLAAHGLTLRHYPQSFEHSTLGGWIATRAGGHFATLYTHIDDLLQAAQIVTPAGVLETRRVPASGAGPDPNRWVLGSEGTLGVITDAWMRVRPRPTFRASATVAFSEWGDAVLAVRSIAQSRLYPAGCRLLDRREAGISFTGDGKRHLLLLGFESADHPVGAAMARALELCADHRGQCDAGPRLSEGDAQRSADRDGGGAAGNEAWRKAFIDAPYLMNSFVSLGLMVDTFETACTWSDFDAMHANTVDAVRDAMRRTAGAGSLSCRFTHVYPDGPAPYYTFIAPAQHGAELSQWAEIKQAASEAILRCGGTITHHHAVGRVHRPWYDRERPEVFAHALRAAKRALDPVGVLNPGVLLDPRAPAPR